MTSIAQINENEQREIEGTLRKFFIDYRVRDLLKGCRAEKQKGHSAFQIFRYLLCLVFCDRSMYMQIITGRYSEAFGKNTVYRFLNSARTNWERLTCALSARMKKDRSCGLPDKRNDLVFYPLLIIHISFKTLFQDPLLIGDSLRDDRNIKQHNHERNHGT